MFDNLFYRLNLAKKLLIDKYPKLSKVLSVNYGLVSDEYNEKDYVMGASDDKINWKILKPDGNWLPEAEKMIDEIQRGRYFDTMGCTGYALNNIEEMIRINKWGKVTNQSDRFLNKASGTSKRGNKLSTVLEARRNMGFVDEKDWAWNRDKFNWDSYYAPLTQEIKNKALLNKKKYTFGYDGVWVTKATLLEALKYSPLYVGLYAWYRKGMLYYSVAGPNHATVIINRNTFICYDSYSPHIKYLDEDFIIYYVKRIYLEKAGIEYNIEEIKKLRARGFEYIMRTDKLNGGKGEVYMLTKDNKVVELTDQEKLEVGIEGLAKRNDLTGIAEKYYFNLIY